MTLVFNLKTAFEPQRHKGAETQGKKNRAMSLLVVEVMSCPSDEAPILRHSAGVCCWRRPAPGRCRGGCGGAQIGARASLPKCQPVLPEILRGTTLTVKEPKTKAYVAMPSHLSGEWASVGKLLISCLSSCLCVSVGRNVVFRVYCVTRVTPPPDSTRTRSPTRNSWSVAWVMAIIRPESSLTVISTPF